MSEYMLLQNCGASVPHIACIKGTEAFFEKM